MGLDDVTDSAKEEQISEEIAEDMDTDPDMDALEALNKKVKDLNNGVISHDKRMEDLEGKVDNLETLVRSMVSEFNELMDELAEEQQNNTEETDNEGYNWK